MLVDPGSIGATVALLVLMVSVFPYIERRLGAWRFVAALVLGVVATGLTLGFASPIASQWPRWSDALVNGWSNGAIPALRALPWRRRGVQPPGGVSARDGSVWRSPPWALRRLDLRCHDPRIDGRRPGHRRFWWRGAERFDLRRASAPRPGVPGDRPCVTSPFWPHGRRVLPARWRRSPATSEPQLSHARHMRSADWPAHMPAPWPTFTRTSAGPSCS